MTMTTTTTTTSSRTKNAILLMLAVAVMAVAAADHVVTVGKAAHRFDPDQLTAAIGDTIIFEFYPTNHSVVRGSWVQPCVPYEKLEPQVTGFFSGFRPVRTIERNPPTFSILVNDTNPMFFYCSAPDSCNVWGMAGVINPRSDTPIAGYQAAAKKPGTFVLQPGEDWPSESDNSVVPPAPTSVPTGSTGLPGSTGTLGGQTTVTAVASPTASSSSSGLSTGSIAGITIGAVGVIALICGLFFYLGRRHHSDATAAAPPAPPHHSIIYEKQPPPTLAYAPPMSPQSQPISPLYAEPIGYRAYSPDPRAFPPGVLADDKAYRRSQQSPVVELGSPAPGATWETRADSYPTTATDSTL